MGSQGRISQGLHPKMLRVFPEGRFESEGLSAPQTACSDLGKPERKGVLSAGSVF